MHELEFGPAREGKKLVVTTASSIKSRDDVAAGLASLRGQKVNADIAAWRDVLPKQPLRLFERDNIGRSESIELVGGRTLPLQTPIPRQVSTTPENRIRWLTELQSPTWRPVRHAALGVELLQTPAYDSEHVRTSREGLAYFCPHVILLGNDALDATVVRPTVSPMSLLGQVERIAQAAGWRVALSDKGIYATESAKLFGGTRELAKALRNPIVRKILDAFVAKSGPGQLLSSDSRRYLSWKSLEEIVGEMAIAEHAPPLLDGHILERGLILQCARCRQKGWYDLERVSDAFRCSRCRLTQPFEARWGSTPEPPWFYGLAEVLRQFLTADGDLPVLAVHDAFGDTEMTRQTFELDLFPFQGKPLELDIFASEGSRLWIGDANRSGEFDTARIQRLVETARTFDAHGIVLATSKVRWPPRTTSAVETVMSGISNPAVKLLVGI